MDTEPNSAAALAVVAAPAADVVRGLAGQPALVGDGPAAAERVLLLLLPQNGAVGGLEARLLREDACAGHGLGLDEACALCGGGGPCFRMKAKPAAAAMAAQFAAECAKRGCTELVASNMAVAWAAEWRALFDRGGRFAGAGAPPV